MQLIKERSFQGLLGSSIITMEGWHCFERDNTGEGAGRRRSPSHDVKMADDSPEPVCELLPAEENDVFLNLFLFFYCLSRSVLFISKDAAEEL